MKGIISRALLLLAPVCSYAAYSILFSYPEAVENVYSRGIYPVLSKIFGFIPGLLPFSLAEFLLYLFALLMLIGLIRAICGLFRRRDRLLTFFKRLLSIIVACGFIYSAFIFGWGINYARMPVAVSMGYSQGEYSAQELYSATAKLAVRASELRAQCSEDDAGCFEYTRTRQSVMELIPEVYSAGAQSFMCLARTGRVKGVTLADGLSRINTQGIFSPFTYEPNINMQMPDLFFAASCAHEYAHLQGFAREDEAEFLCYYVTRDSVYPDIAYSGTATALNRALSALYSADRALWEKAASLVSEGIWRDFAQHNAYWESFKGELSEASETLNNSYLQSNRQQDGVKSYGRMLDIILAMDKAGDLK